MSIFYIKRHKVFSLCSVLWLIAIRFSCFFFDVSYSNDFVCFIYRFSSVYESKLSIRTRRLLFVWWIYGQRQSCSSNWQSLLGKQRTIQINLYSPVPFMQRYIKSVYWLVGCSGLGYVLLQLTQPSEHKLAEIRHSAQFTAEQNRKAALFMEKLKESTQNK